MASVPALLQVAVDRLAAAGIDSPRVDAELLLAELLGVERGLLVTRTEISDATAGTYREHVARRAAREPLQHITGTAPFRHLMLDVGPGVFVPRPETELLVDAVLPRLRAVPAPTVVDLCAGSGALALAIAHEVPDARVLAVENAFGALRWLGRNASGTRVRVLAGDIRDPELLEALSGRVEVVVSNPPYVPIGTPVAAEVRADPCAAVFAGPDGLDLVPTVITRAAALLTAGGVLALEHDETHAEQVLELLARGGRFADVTGHRDLTGRPRYATAVRACASHTPA